MSISFDIFNADLTVAGRVFVEDIVLRDERTGQLGISWSKLCYQARRKGQLPPQVGDLYWIVELNMNGDKLTFKLPDRAAFYKVICMHAPGIIEWCRGELQGDSLHRFKLVRTLPGLEVSPAMNRYSTSFHRPLAQGGPPLETVNPILLNTPEPSMQAMPMIPLMTQEWPRQRLWPSQPELSELAMRALRSPKSDPVLPQMKPNVAAFDETDSGYGREIDLSAFERQRRTHAEEVLRQAMRVRYDLFGEAALNLEGTFSDLKRPYIGEDVADGGMTWQDGEDGLPFSSSSSLPSRQMEYF